MWLGMGLSQTFLSDVFGVQNITYVDTEHFSIPVLDNPLNKAIRQVLSKIQKERSHTMRVCILLQLNINKSNIFHVCLLLYFVYSFQLYVKKIKLKLL